jgi:hypothetical protein
MLLESTASGKEEVESPVEDFIAPSEPPAASKKRSRKQSEPKRLEDVVTGPGGELAAKKSKKALVNEAEVKNIRNIVSQLEKERKIHEKSYQDVLALNEKDLNNPTIIKAYALPAFQFLGLNEIIATGVFESRNYFLICEMPIEKLKKMEKRLDDYGLTPEQFAELFGKFGKKYWKISVRDYDKLTSLLNIFTNVRCILTNIEKTTFENKHGDGTVTCLVPKFVFKGLD